VGRGKLVLLILLAVVMSGCGEKIEYKRGNLITYNPKKTESLEPFVYNNRGQIQIISNDSVATYNESKKAYGSDGGGYVVFDWSKPYIPIIKLYKNKDES